MLQLVLMLSFVPFQIVEIPQTPASLQSHFSEFAVNEAFTGEPAAVILSSPEWRQYRTMLRSGAKKGPNFAGHFTVVQWGCGTTCLTGAIVDATTGKVCHLPPLLKGTTVGFEAMLLHFRLESRLMIVCTDC